ncbi:hypothetical protein G4B88_021831 [Cannabis sativa]|uniref:Uncharacterized protein n=1 Tax=Cannabis sativa TaxID=3483 RepID=A0A7J6EI48_CANSA|nr:hypothetical protein G4B88_021831 [Cannabis sativa]
MEDKKETSKYLKKGVNFLYVMKTELLESMFLFEGQNQNIVVEQVGVTVEFLAVNSMESVIVILLL